MEIRTTYKAKIDGIIGFYCGFKPEGAEILEERKILYPTENMELQNKETKEKFSAVWLKENDSQDNYEEIEIKVDNNERN